MALSRGDKMLTVAIVKRKVSPYFVTWESFISEGDSLCNEAGRDLYNVASVPLPI